MRQKRKFLEYALAEQPNDLKIILGSMAGGSVIFIAFGLEAGAVLAAAVFISVLALVATIVSARRRRAHRP